ncbi:hypothetical protein DHD80_10535 [Gramella sp. AN32]|nr:hypothetical protein [Gramella sp. AN32]
MYTGMLIKEFSDGMDCLTSMEYFSNAMDAIKYVNENPVDLILLELHLPEFMGLIQSLKKIPKIIIIISDLPSVYKASGFPCEVEYLIKPFSKEKFDVALHKAHNYKSINSNSFPIGFAGKN